MKRQKIYLSNLAGALLVVSGITHLAQLFVYEHTGNVIGAAIFGVIYFIIGAGILKKESLTFYWAGAVLPSIGGVLGVYRYVNLHVNPFSIFHVGIDILVVPICIYYIYVLSKIEREC